MTLPFAINGLGRIGRSLARVATSRSELGLELVAVNDLADAGSLARLLERDSIHGRFPGEVSLREGRLQLGRRDVAVFSEEGIGAAPWSRTAARIVVEATGAATCRRSAAAHLGGSVAKVVISAPAPDADATLCCGLNEDRYDAAHHQVVSSTSCTTHALAAVLKALHERFGVRHALMNEVHSYTADQTLVDGPHRDPRRSRAAAINIVPTTTRAPSEVAVLLPSLSGRLDGMAVRVPTPDVALLDVVVRLQRRVSVDEVNDGFRSAADGELATILGVSDEPLVSSDYVGDPRSVVVDLGLTQALGGLVRVMGWYDNEWGYANRLAELLAFLSHRLP